MIFKTKGVCAKEIHFEIIDNHLHHVQFIGGCDGNLKAISKLVDGMPVDKVVDLLKGNLCGQRSTSCTDQLAIAIQEKVKECH